LFPVSGALENCEIVHYLYVSASTIRDPAMTNVAKGTTDVDPQTAATPHTLNLIGAFRLAAPDGRRIEIVSKKGTALIATLAMAKDGERTRAWLYDKLWGSRSELQARSSLRRELSNLRKLLNTPDLQLLVCAHDRVGPLTRAMEA